MHAIRVLDFQAVDTIDMPIFRHDGTDYTFFYAPGCLCVVSANYAETFEQKITATSDTYWGQILWEQAQQAVIDYEALQSAPFEPECLTLYLHNDCNLACTYCYTNPPEKSSIRLDFSAIERAAEQVAVTCQKKDLPFHIVLHGGGEPTLYRADVEAVLEIIERVATKYQVKPFRYIATNGVLSEAKARWIAQKFDLIGLSCDGMPIIQNTQRPHLSGGKTALSIEQTADIFHQEGQVFHVRATITVESMTQQPEIADYVCQRLAPEAIHFEAVYSGGRTSQYDLPQKEQAHIFVEGFLAAQEITADYDIPLECSGSRLDTIHGPYCNVFRQVLNLVPGGAVTACFKATDSIQAQEQQFMIGHVDANSIELDQIYIQTLRNRLTTIPRHCEDCFNYYHCVRDCPDGCLLSEKSSESKFRCEIQHQLSSMLLWKRAQELIPELESIRTNEETVYGTKTF